MGVLEAVVEDRLRSPYFEGSQKGGRQRPVDRGGRHEETGRRWTMVAEPPPPPVRTLTRQTPGITVKVNVSRIRKTRTRSTQEIRCVSGRRLRFAFLTEVDSAVLGMEQRFVAG